MHTFGEESMKQYRTLHPDLQLILAHTLIGCEIDFSLTEGYRSPEKQFEYFKQGRIQDQGGNWIVANASKIITNVDGYKVIGLHNHNPSMAVDIAIHVPNKPALTYDKAHLAYLAGSMLRIADKLFTEKRITHKLRWGGNWEKDGDLTNSKLYDSPHFELYKS